MGSLITDSSKAIEAAEAEIADWLKLSPARQHKVTEIRRRAVAVLREVETLGMIMNEQVGVALKHKANAPIKELPAKDDDAALKWLDTVEAELAKNRPVIRPRRIAAASLDGKPVPDREWLVPGLIPAGNVTLLYGDGGTGKSLVALQLAASTAIGALFFGRPVNQGASNS